MRETRLMMGMPITVEIVDPQATKTDLAAVFNYFNWVDQTFSTYKETSEISRINAGKLKVEAASLPVIEVLRLCEQTKQETDGYFDIYHQGKIDPSGLVKGWAIQNAAKQLATKFAHFYVEAGGDIQVKGKNANGEVWTVGIRHPQEHDKIVKVLEIKDKGVATSGTYERGQHVYDPFNPKQPLDEIVSLTVIGPNVYEADRFATAAFAMGRKGIEFINQLPGFAAYQIDCQGMALMTSNMAEYVREA